MATMKLGTDRHRPPGDWVQATSVFKVAGIAHRKGATLQWIRDIARSLRARMPYGVIVEKEPDNPKDRNALKYMGSRKFAAFSAAYKRKPGTSDTCPRTLRRTFQPI
jgi:hypothetical protein